MAERQDFEGGEAAAATFADDFAKLVRRGVLSISASRCRQSALGEGQAKDYGVGRTYDLGERHLPARANARRAPRCRCRPTRRRWIERRASPPRRSRWPASPPP